MDIEHIGYVVEDPRAMAAWYVKHLGMKVVRCLGEPNYTQFLADSSRCYKSPADLLALKAPHLSPKIFLLYPIPLESLLHLTGGHDVPGRMKTFASDPDPKNC